MWEESQIVQKCTERWVAGFCGNSRCGIVFFIPADWRVLGVFLGFFAFVIWWVFGCFSLVGHTSKNRKNFLRMSHLGWKVKDR